MNLDAKTRAYIYRVALAVLALAAVYGFVSDEQVPAIAALLAALLPTGLAVANTSTKA